MRIFDADVTGSLHVSGSSELRGDLIVSGSQTITGSLIVNGNTKIGDELTDNHNFTGSLLVRGSVSSSLTGSLRTDYIDFNTGSTIAGAVGRMKWNDTDGTIDVGMKGGNVTLQVGQEFLIRVVNKTGVNLLESGLTAVRADGAQGNRLKVSLALADNDDNSANTLGLVTENINNNDEGFVTTSGLVRNINTTGAIQGELWVEGDLLFLSPTVAGGITNVKPVAPQHLVIIGYVVRAHATQGSIFVKVDNGYELDELHNVKINTGSLSYGDLLMRSGSVWANSKALSGSYQLTGSLDISGSQTINGNQIVSGSLTITNNITVLGTSSFVYVTSSNLNLTGPYIYTNVFEPIERFGGLVVFDSGSLSHQATASLLWDSLNNHWIYQNASGSSYSGGMLLSGPRNSGSLGNEVGLTSTRIPKSVGGDHLDNSNIYDTGTVVKIISNSEITGSLKVTSGISGSIDYSYIQNAPSLVSGSSQINITGTTGYSTVSGSIAAALSGSWIASDGTSSDTISFGETVTIQSGVNTLVNFLPGSNTFVVNSNHPSVSASPSSNNSGRTYIQDILVDSFGHITGITTASETVVNTDSYTTGVTFNTSDGVVTFTRNDGNTYTVDLDGRYGTSSSDYYVTGGTFNSSTGNLRLTRNDGGTIDTNLDGRYLTSHPSVSAASSSDNSGRTYIQDILVDSFGHITGITTSTETVVDTYTTGGTTNSTTGLITFTKSDGGTYTTSISGYVSTQIANLIDSAPTTLDTLNELAAALGDDPNFATTFTTLIGNKVSKSGDTMTGNLTAPKFITSGGTSSQFVKGDGTLDSSTYLTSFSETDTLATVTARGSSTATPVTFNSDVTLGNSADLKFVDLAGTFPTSGKGFDWTLNNDGARIYAIQPASDSIDLIFQLRDNATTNDRFVFHVADYQGPAFHKYPLIIRAGTEFDLVDSSLYVGGTLVLSNGRVLQNVTGNISMFTNDSGYLTAHPSVSAASSSNNSGRTYIQDILLDSFGHITGITTATETVTDTNYYVTGATFNTGDGVITLTRNDGNTITVDIDGRFLTSYTETDTLATVTARGNVTNQSITVSGVTSYNDVTISGGTLTVYESVSGATVFAVDGTNGRLFAVTDDLSNSLFSVNTISGLPVIEAFADYHIVMGRFNQNDFYLGTTGEIGMGLLPVSGYKLAVSGNVRATSFVKSGGTSSQFLKADGSVDSNTYLTSYLNYYTTGVTFNTGDGVLTFSRNDGNTYTVDLDGRYGTSTTDYYTSGATFNTGDGVLTFTRTDGGTYTVDLDGRYGTSSSDYYTTGATFNTGNGIITFSRTDGNTYTVDLDGKYLDSSSYTASDVLSKLLTVDGSGSTLDADLLDGQHGSYYYPASNPSGYTSNAGTVTSVAALTIGNSGTDVTSTVTNGTTTPVITLDIPDASDTARGLITTSSQNIAGTKTFTTASRTTFSNSDFLQAKFQNGASTVQIGSASNVGRITSNGSIGLITNYPTNNNFSLYINSDGRVLFNTTTDNNVDTVQVNGSVIATSIKKSGGTSSQFLMADGSVSTNPGWITSYTDTNYYVTGATFNTSNGVITMTRNDGGTVTVDIDGRFSELGHTHDDRYLPYSKTSDVNKASGWYTIAVNTGSRAVGKFILRDTSGGNHQSAVFYATHHYGNYSDITVLINSRYGGNPFRYIRIQDGGTYDGALLQVYIDDSSSQVQAWMLENIQASGWIIKDWIPDGTDPGDVTNFAALTTTPAQVDLDTAGQGGMIVTGPIYGGGDTTQYEYLNTNNYSTTTDTRYYTETEIGNFFGGSSAITGYNKSNWDTAYGWGNHASQGYATTGYVQTQISNLIDSAPGTLDTLNELAAAINDDPNFYATITGITNNKVSKSGDTMTGNLSFGASSGLGLTWGLNTDSAFIKFISTSNAAGASYLEIGTTDDSDEEIKFTQSGNVRAYIATDGFFRNGGGYKYLYENGTWGIDISGNAATVTNGVYTNGSYSNPAWITALAGSKITGNISGNAYNITQYTINQDLGTSNSVSFNAVTSPVYYTAASSTRSKIILWGTDTNYAIGMESAVVYGGLNDYAMTFQMNNEDDRGFWWGDSIHSTSQGAMALTTNGYLTVARGVRVGYGESDTTTPNVPLQVYGSGSLVFDVQGSQGQLFSITDNLSGSLFSVNDISGLPILEVFSDDKLVAGSFGTNAFVVSGTTTTVSGSLAVSGSATVNGGTVWHSGNDGSGSGLDADTLDGLHASSFLTSYSETDTLSSVTARGNTTTTHIGVTTSSPINLAASGNLGTWIGGIQDATAGWSITNNGIGLKADNNTYAGMVLAGGNGLLYFGRTNASGVGTMSSWLEVNSSGTANFKLSRPQHNGSNLALVSEIPTNLNQLTNGPGYITAHPSVSAAGSSNNSGRTYIQDILLDGFGHITGITTASETVVDTDTNYYLNSASFNTGDGVLTLGVTGYGNVTVDLDGRYQAAGSYLTAESDTLATVTTRGASTTNDITIGGLTVGGSLSYGTWVAASNYVTGADNIVLKGNASGVSGIFFESEKDGTNINHPSDFGFIQYHAYGIGGSSGESNRLVIGVSNDADDIIVLNPVNTNGLVVRVGAGTTEYTVYHSGNIPTWNQNTTGTASNITAYTINQSVGTGNSPTFAGLTSNGVGIFNSTNDTQISLRSTDAWSGIEFDDSGTPDYIWYNGGNQTFSIGGGGGNVSGKKLHVHGGVTIGSSYTSTSVTTNGLAVEGSISASNFSGSSSGTNTGDQTNISGNAGTIDSNPNRTDVAAYPVVWSNGNSQSPNYSCAAVTIQSSTGKLTANSFVKSSGTSAQFLMADGSVSTNPGWITSYVDTDTNYYVTGATFNTSNGVITMTRNDGGTITVDIDGRYLESYSETDTLASVTSRGATTSTNLTFSGDNGFSGTNTFSNSYNEFGNGHGSVSNDGGWNGRVNIAGTAHARLDVVSVSDGIITSMYSHTGNGAGKMGTMSNHPLNLIVDGNVRTTLDASGNLGVTGTITGTDIYASNWFRNTQSNEGLYNEVTTQHLSSNANGYWDMSSTTSFSGIRFYTGGHVSSLRGYVYANTSNEIGFLNSGGNWSLRCDNSQNVHVTTAVYAPIYYDSNDNNYYLNPASTSNLKTVKVNSTVAGTEALTVDGVNGRLFTITDDMTDSIFSVNTISGLPVIEAFADYTVVMGRYGLNDLKIDNAGAVTIRGNTVWHAGNDGASSGLDADLLDGQHGSYYATATSLGSYLPLAGGTMTGTITITNTDIRSNSTSNWTGDPGTQGKIQYHSARWYIVSDSGSDRIVQFRRNTADVSHIANDGTFVGNVSGNATTATAAQNATFLTQPNATWAGRLQLGGNGAGSGVNAIAVVQSTDGNLHMDNGLAKEMYLNYYHNGKIYLNGGTYFISANGSQYNGNSSTASALTSMNISQFTNDSAYITGISFASVSSKPTTLSGYGISDGVKTNGTLSGNIDSDWGESFTTFDPIPTGTPPLASPNIRTINIGANYSRRTQLAFDYASDLAYFRRRNDSGWQTWREFIHSGNIGSFALTSLPSHNHDDRYFTETESDARFQPLENQRLSTGNLPTFAGVKGSSYFDAQASSGFRIRNSNDTANTGAFTRRGLWEGNSNYDPAIWAETGYSIYIYTNGSATIRAYWDTSGHLLPGQNNTYDLGSPSLGWRNIYTNDLHLSNMNKPEGNDIDGTSGTWTIQEGNENLYVINNLNGKKYRMTLEEI
jgi:hypothetical protein